MVLNKGKDLSKVKILLEEGHLVGIPTETVYGLAANAFNSEAVTNIFKAKQRPAFDPLILHTNSLEKIKTFVSDIPPIAYKLAQAFWPGPLTLIFQKKQLVHDIVTSGLDTVAVRIPRHPLTLQLLSLLDFPLAAPSANPFGYISPTTADHVLTHLGDKVGYVLDGGACEVGIESTIVGFPNNEPTVYRKGGVEIEAIESIIGKVTVNEHSNSQPQAPGMLKKHYSPKTSLVIGHINTLLDKHQEKRIGILSFQKSYNETHYSKQIVLSPKGDLAEAAKNLFTALRELDNSPLDIIISELLPEQGLGVAINDRIKRAAVAEQH